MRKDHLKNRIEELFSPAEEELLGAELTLQPAVETEASRQPSEGATDSQIMLAKRVRELNCLNEIGLRIDEKPAVPEFLAWVAQIIPSAMYYPEFATAAITYKQGIYGDQSAINLSSKIVAGIRIANELVGYIHLAYRKPLPFADEESAFLGAVTGRVAGYLENRYLFEQMERHQKELMKFKKGIDLTTDAVFITDVNGVIIYINPSFEKIYGFTPADALGKTPRILKSGLIPPEQYQQFWQTLLSGNIVSGEIINKTKDGRLITIEGANIPIKDEKNQLVGFLAIHRDVSERKLEASLLKKRAEDLEAVAELSTTISAILDPDDLLETVVNLSKKMFNLYHAQIYLLDEKSKELVLSSAAGEVGRSMVQQGWKIPLEHPASIVAKAAREKQGWIVNDVRNEPDFLPNPALSSTASELAVPILIGDTVLGVLDVQSDQANFFHSEDLSIQTALAGQVAVALQNARLYQTSQNALAQSEMLLMISQATANSFQSNEILAQALEKLVQITGYSCGLISMFNPETQALELTVHFNLPEAMLETLSSHGLAGTLCEYVFEQNDKVVLEDLSQGSPVNPSGLLALGLSSYYGIPLRSRGLANGTLCLFGDSHHQKRLTNTDELMQAASQQIGMAVENAWLFKKNQTALAQLEDQLHEMENYQRMLSHEAWSSYRSRMDQSILGYIFSQDQVQPLSKEFMTQIRGNGKKETANSDQRADAYTTPLQVQGEKIGGLGLYDPNSLDLSEEEIHFLQSVAEQVSQALERARLIEQTQKTALELQTVAQVSSASSTVLDPEELLQSVVDLAKNSFGLYHAHIYLLDEMETKLVLASGAGETGRKMKEEGWIIFLDDESIVAKAAVTRQGQIVNDVRSSPDFLPNPLLPNTASELAVPMIAGQKLLGVFDVQSDRINNFTENDLKIYMTLATQTAVALQNARLFAEQSITVERLRELDHLKTSFLANMSHELRTPLNSILGFTQVILEGIDGPLTDYMVSDLQLIEKNGKHLLNLINEVLDMAKIEAGRMSLTIETVDLRELLEDVLETTSAQAREKSIYLNLDIDPTAELIITGDQIRLRQIMLNLVGNAIKFTETGGVTVKAEVLNDQVNIRVSDTGIGIAPDKLETIFEAFSQVDTSTTRKAGGTGLGLPISRRLVEMHGGKLWAESQGEGMGTTMHLVLPIHAKTS